MAIASSRGLVLLAAIGCLWAGLAETNSAHAQNAIEELPVSSNDELTPPVPSPEMSVENATDCVARLFNAWTKTPAAQMGNATNNGAPAQGYSFMREQGLRAAAAPAAALGPKLIVQVRQVFMEKSRRRDIPAETGRYVQVMLTEALRKANVGAGNHAFEEESVSQRIEKIRANPERVFEIYSISEWWTCPEVVQLIKDLLKSPDGGKPESAFDQVTTQALNPDRNDQAGERKKNSQARTRLDLLNMAIKISDPDLQAAVRDAIQGAIQDENTDRLVLNGLLENIMNDPAGTYSSSVPGLLAAFNVRRKKGNDDMDLNFAVFNFLSKNPKTCLDPEMRQAAHDMVAFDRDRARDDPDYVPPEDAPAIVAAFFGDTDAFQKVIRHCQGEKIKFHGGLISRTEPLLIRSVVFTGPGDHDRGVLNNADQAKFDSTTGQWSVTAPPDYQDPGK